MNFLIAIPSCKTRTYPSTTRVHVSGPNTRIDWLRKAWLNACPYPYKLFYGAGAESPDEVNLNCPDDYLGLFYKIQAMYRWCLAAGYEYVFRCDDDVWVDPARLEASFTPCDYRGYISGDGNEQWVAGFAYWISRRAMEIIVNANQYYWAEDQLVGRILRCAGIFPESAFHFEPCCCPYCVPKMAHATCLHCETSAAKEYVARGVLPPAMPPGLTPSQELAFLRSHQK